MKKILKNTSLTIIAIILAFMFVIDVQAATCEGELGCRITERGKILVKYGSNNKSIRSSGTSVNKNSKTGNKYSSIGIEYKGVPNGTFSYYWTELSGIGKSLYCLDGNLQGYSPLYAKRFLLDPGDSLKQRAYDLAHLSIMTNGGKGVLNMPSDNVSDYSARLMAIRAIRVTFGYDASGVTVDNRILYSYKSMTHGWLTADSSDYNKINDALKSKGESLKDIASLKSDKYGFSGTTIDNAKNYYFQALKEVAAYVSGDAGSNEVKKETIVAAPVVTTGTLVKRTVTHTIKVPGNLTSLIIKGVKLNGTYTGVTAKIASIKVDGKDGSVGAELKSLIPSTGAKVVITVSFEGDSGVLVCEESPIKYYIDGSYKGDAAGAYKDFVGIQWYTGHTGGQEYISVEKAGSDDGSEGTSLMSLTQNETSLLDCELPCTTYVEKFECCDENNNLIVSEADDKEVKILGPGYDTEKNNVKACFVTAVDKACVGNDCTKKGSVDEKGNSYSLKEVNDNKYCTVSCKEDYTMTLPTARIVNAGRYFTFKAKVEGQKACYSNTVNIKEYKKDIIEKQEAMVNAYTEYKKWEALSKATIQSKTDNKATASNNACKETGTRPKAGGGTESYCVSYCDAKAETANWTTYFVKNVSYSGFTVSSRNFEEGTITIAPYNGTADYAEDGHIDGTATAWNCGSSKTEGTSGTSEKLTANIKAKLAEAEKALENAKKAYEDNIKLYAQCSGGSSSFSNEWTSKVNYAPEVYYDYNENYLELLNPSIGVMNGSTSPRDDYEKMWCTGDVDNDYKCTSGEFSNREGTLEEKAYIVCTKDNSCKVETRNEYKKVSKAKYVMKKSDVEASYKPATLFYNIYPSGEITITPADNNVPLENGLPVSLGTKRGAYRYTVNMENLGEFYDKGTLGRYVGSKTSPSSTAVISSENLVYSCAYLVNIPITDGWVCDFDNCPECIANCVGPLCPGYCDGNDCIADCIGIGCIYSEGSTILEKQVSLNNLFPDGTNSYNWNRNVNQKAEQTISEIESKANAIYEDDPILSITINPSTARSIKVYNKDAEENGGYSNDTMSCWALGGYGEIACYSSFITDLLKGTFGGNIVDSKSEISKSGYRKVGDNNTEYFSTWSGAVSDKSMIGPSWK